MFARIFFALLIFFLSFPAENLSASETQNGNIRLIIDERLGRFSLYFLSDPETKRYEPLFNSTDPNATYASVNVDGRVFRLGDRNFRPRYERQNGNPGFIFESPNLTVRQVFSPVRTPNSPVINGVMISFTIQNTGNRDAMIGFRFLIDTELGDGRGRVPFITSSRIVENELLLDSSSGERFWISRGNNVSLMGSIINPENPDDKVPDFIHFANWRRLDNSSWRLRYSQRRSFSNDSAVCYIYEPSLLISGETFTYTIFLTTEDVLWYNSANRRPAALINESSISLDSQTVQPAPAVLPTINIEEIEREAIAVALLNNENISFRTLVKLQEILNQFLAGELVLNEQDLIEIEKAIGRHRQ